jgi:hypothetical protein
MKPVRFLAGLTACALTGMADDQFFDRVEQALTFSAVDSRVRARLSGTLEVEGYDYQLPAPGVIDAAGNQLLAERCGGAAR